MKTSFTFATIVSQSGKIWPLERNRSKTINSKVFRSKWKVQAKKKNKKPSDLITHVQNDLKSLKKEPPGLRAAMGNVQPGKVMNFLTVRNTSLGIRVRGIRESDAVTEFERKQADLAAIDNILLNLIIEDKKFVKTARISKFNAEKRPWYHLNNTVDAPSKTFIFKSAVKLKGCKALKVYISPGLSRKDAEVKNNSLREKNDI